LGVLLAINALGAWGAWAASTRAEPPAKGADPKAQTAVPAKATETKPPEKRIAFEMRDKKWSEVFEWLGDHTGLKVISPYIPGGTFNFIAPRDANKQPQTYTIPEIIDIINEGLLVNPETQQYVLLRRKQSFTLQPANEKIRPEILERISVEDLPKHGKTEIVSVILQLNAVVAEDLAPAMKKLVGPFGEVVAIEAFNQLYLQDTVGSLERIIKTIKAVEGSGSAQGRAEVYSHKCEYILAHDAEETIRKSLGDPLDLLKTVPQPTFRFGGGPGGGGGGPGGGPQPTGGGGQTQTPRATAAVPKVRMYYVTSDERTNTVIVTGPQDKVTQAKAIIKTIDVGPVKVGIGPPTFQTYSVPGGNAEAVAKSLNETYKGSGSLRMQAISNNLIMVYAVPEMQLRIAADIQGTKNKNITTVLLSVNEQDAAAVAKTLQNMFGETKGGAPFIDADTAKNAIQVRGTLDQVEDVKSALKAITGGGGGFDGGNMRTLTLDKGSAAALADALQKLLPDLRKNPVKVIHPGRHEEDKKPQKPKEKSPKLDTSVQRPGTPEGQFVAQIVDPQKDKQENGKKDGDNRPGRADMPITITAFGNRLMIHSEDPKALALVTELVRLYTQTKAGEGDFEIIRLKNASATEAAQMLDEFFNPPKEKTPNQGGFPFGGRGFGGFPGGFGRGGMTQQAEQKSEPRIRVVADTGTNSLLVKATPIDMLTIRSLLERAIDTGESDSRAVMRPWVIKLKNARASDVAEVVRDVFREQMNNNPVTSAFVGGPGFGIFSRSRGVTNLNVDANGNPRAVTLTVSADDKSNKLLLRCPEVLKKEVEYLVAQLDEDQTRSVKVMSIRGVDPLLVQQAIEAIQGRSVQNNNGRPGFVPFGTGGMITPGSGRSYSPGGGYGTGYTPGSGRGYTPGGGGPGGGGFTPGGGGGGGRRGGGFTPGGANQSRGPDFFEQRVKDDPESFVLFDPQRDVIPITQEVSLPGGDEASQVPAAAKSAPADGPQVVKAEEKPGPAPAPKDEGAIKAPRGPVQAEALEQLGIIVISGNNPRDVEEVVRIIEYIQRLGAGAEVQIQIVPLRQADATSVTNTLNQLYQRVTLLPTSTQIVPGRPGTAGPTITPGFPGAQPAAAQQGQGAVVLLALPRLNSVLVAAPKARVKDIVKDIENLDRPLSGQFKVTAFHLERAAASLVSTQITNFYTSRYPGESLQQHGIRVTFDANSNTVFVQAAPADLAEIGKLIEWVDTTDSRSRNELRIVTLKFALSDDLASILIRAITEGVVPPTVAPALPTGGPGVPAAPGAIPGAIPGQAPGATATTAAARAQGIVTPTKTTSLRFYSERKEAPNVYEAGVLEDIFITSDPRTNSLIISAPEKTMKLIQAVIQDLDVVPTARANVHVFTLKKADAATMASMLQQLFVGTGAATGAPTPARPGLPGFPAVPTAPGATTQATQVPPLGEPTPGAPLVPLRVTIDDRTNSLIVAGSQSDLDVIRPLVSRLDDAPIQERRNEVYKMHNAIAADVATALTTFLPAALKIYQTGGQLYNFQEIQRDIVVVPEPVTNSLLISATPKYFEDLLRIIAELDAQPPQVVIQCLVAEVDLTGTEEFGVEIGLQSPVIFQRGITPAPGFLGAGTINYATTAIPAGVTVNSSVNPVAAPGFNFNTSPGGPPALGNNPVVGPGIVGYQGLGNLGVGRVSTIAPGVSGFVFSAASDSFNLLIRALRTQGRIDILSRPQVTTTDNQTATTFVGQYFPYVTGSTVTTGVTGIPTVVNTVNYRNIGVQLQVTPKIMPDGSVVMRVTPEISSPATTMVNLGNGVNATAFNTQTVDTTVIAMDGETVAIGGLISKRNEKNENKIPWVGDLPCVGTLFRYRNQIKTKTELLVILTPHVVRCAADRDRILAMEAKRMDWVLGDVLKIQGTSGMEPILPPPNPGMPHGDLPPGPAVPHAAPPAVVPPVLPAPAGPPNLPLPRSLPPVQGQAPAANTVTPVAVKAPAAAEPALAGQEK
jgi:type II secretion system protein D